jgi:CDP-paratose 2-epimerase
VTSAAAERPILITGGAGFIGTNLADAVARRGRSVIVYDSLSRAGVERNLAWLRRQHGDLIQAEIADIRDRTQLREAVHRVGQVFHFAAQVAVTTSLADPAEDFAVNAGGTLNLLEAIRECPNPPPLVFTSTNKVYGGLEDLKFSAEATRYVPEGEGRDGIGEHRPLDFHSPYGCSKGAADQYVLDYGRSFGLPTAVLRMSCIYGPHQCGTEDQGWVAHFLIRALQGQPITIYGDGKQVRDILYVDDLVDALLLAQAKMTTVRGRAFNIGGGSGNTVSLLELLELIEDLLGRAPKVSSSSWRTGDQRFYVSDHSAFSRATGWIPRVGTVDGIARLHRWLAENVPATPSSRRIAAAGVPEGRPAAAAPAGAPAAVPSAADVL